MHETIWTDMRQAIALDVVRPQNPEFEVQEFDGRTLPLEDKSVDCCLAHRQASRNLRRSTGMGLHGLANRKSLFNG